MGDNKKKPEYPFMEIERKWQKKWEEQGVHKAKNYSDKKKYYVLSMFPYPSGALHIGHVSNYSIADAIARFKMMEGYNMLQPMGYDAFGMPAENFAILNNSHPSITTEENIKTMYSQFKAMGFAIDWDRELSTCRPSYYKWGQWLFKKMYEKGLVYRKTSWINWCDDCQTVLANEQVEDQKCWRCDSQVRQKELMQWFFRITDYAEELLDFSKMIDWPERVKAMQTNWIGKSQGTEVDFLLISNHKSQTNNSPENTQVQEVGKSIIKIFTTRPDTLFGVTFMALPPEHPLIVEWLKHEPEDSEILKFCEKVINEDKITRTAADTTKEGIFTGRYCINPVNGDEVQIWITNYVLMDYGTGAVMGVPAHDQRDFEFAKKYHIPIKIVIIPENEQLSDNQSDCNELKSAYIDEGILANSGDFEGMKSELSKSKITEWLLNKGSGRASTTYRLRDWGISRQRYWGTPIPVIHCDDCGVVLVPDSDLPVELPMEVQVGKTTKNPLLSVEKWINVPCPKCQKSAKRETDTMDTFVDSSWYFARYIDSKNQNKPFEEEIADYWLPVDQYIGGIEHACMHLLYARFFHKFMRDIGLVNSDEPFLRLLSQGMVLKDGFKMSKSKGNTVDPQEFIDRYGADTVRLFVLFAAPPEKDKEWSKEGVVGCFRFLNRLYHFFKENEDAIKKGMKMPSKNENDTLNTEIKKLRYSTHNTIKRNLEDFQGRMQFNTNIASIMEHFNNLNAIKNYADLSDIEKYYYAEAALTIPKLLYLYSPHLSEEIWSMFYGSCSEKENFIFQSGVFDYNPEFLVLDKIVYVVQINGKVRGRLEIDVNISEEEIKKAALEIENVKKTIEGKIVEKIIVVGGKLVSIVLRN
ncbi:MAG: leucine--tRNA ligase [Candidatus Cloacimonetes bacterium]|nr:leucine--tRNA ligase [Candidatus Cloacimonadota bacterium]